MMWKRNSDQLPLSRPPWGPGPQAGMCPDQEWSQQPFGAQVGAGPTETQQPGLWFYLYIHPSGWTSRKKGFHNMFLLSCPVQ